MEPMTAWQTRLYRCGWAVLQALPWWLVLAGLTWAGYQWPLPLPPQWREGIVLALLLSYAGWRTRWPWSLGLLALLAWSMGSVGALYPLPPGAGLGVALGVTGGLACLWAVARPMSGPGWAGLLFLMWIVYTGWWLYGWWAAGLPGRGWYEGLGLATFFLLLVQAWRDLVTSPEKARAAAGDVYVIFSVLFWVVYRVWR